MPVHFLPKFMDLDFKISNRKSKVGANSMGNRRQVTLRRGPPGV